MSKILSDIDIKLKKMKAILTTGDKNLHWPRMMLGQVGKTVLRKVFS